MLTADDLRPMEPGEQKPRKVFVRGRVSGGYFVAHSGRWTRNGKPVPFMSFETCEQFYSLSFVIRKYSIWLFWERR